MKISVAKEKLARGIEILNGAKEEYNVQVEVGARHRAAVEEARVAAEEEAKRRAMVEAKRIQDKADALAKITATRMEKHILAMEATRTWAAERKESAAAEQQARARAEAERIQAEAKARARVAGEASIIQDAAMARAEAALATATTQVTELRAAWETATVAYEKNVTVLQLKLKEIQTRELAIERASAAAMAAEKRWKMLAQRRAAAEAARIGAEAGARARTQWQAKRIQAMALSKAKAEADAAKSASEKINETSFLVTDELSITINGVTKTFATIEEKEAYMQTDAFKTASLRYREESLVEAEDAWTIQGQIVREVLVKAQQLLAAENTARSALMVAQAECRSIEGRTSAAMNAQAVAQKVSVRANDHAAALLKAAQQLKVEGAAEAVVVEAEANADAAAREATAATTAASKALLGVKTSETAGFTCGQNVADLQRQLSRATLMQRAAKSAAEIQVRAVCRARAQTVRATYDAAVAKRSLESPVVTPLPSANTIDLDACFNGWFVQQPVQNCNLATLSVGPALGVELAPMTGTDGIRFSWEPLTADPQVVGYELQEGMDGKGITVARIMNRAQRGFVASSANAAAAW